MNWYGPSSETECIERNGVRSKVVVNYMIYRRSNIISVFPSPICKCRFSLSPALAFNQQAKSTSHFLKLSSQSLRYLCVGVHVPASACA